MGSHGLSYRKRDALLRRQEKQRKREAERDRKRELRQVARAERNENAQI
jgi:hypothetical protein